MVVEPPVACMPNTGCVYSGLAGACATTILLHSASSSSAINMGSEVQTP
jgi:hypothetical protein